MRLAIIGQRDFGRAVLEAFLARGDGVAGVFCAPEGAAPNAPADPLKLAAQAAGTPVFQFKSLRSADARAALQGLDVDLCVMAYVLQFVPQDFADIPRHGTIQFHPSLLPRYRGASAINWAIIRGDTRTGISVFRPTDGLDEGPLVLQKEAPIGPDATAGSLYFDALFPLGVAALLEAADLVVTGGATPIQQDEALASYEGWCRSEEARIHWHSHVDFVHNLIRGCDPAPAAWCEFLGKKLHLHGVRKHPTRTFAQVKGRMGEVTHVGAQSVFITAQGGQIEVFKMKYGDGKKLPAAPLCSDIGVTVGTVLG